jgi:hypothetical protein
MKSCKCSLTEIVAVVIALAALAGLVVMLNAEMQILPGVTTELFERQVLPNLQIYSLALGLVLLVASIAYILLGREEEISTTLDKQDK